MPYWVTRSDTDEVIAFGEEIIGQAKTIEAAKRMLIRELRDEAEHRWDGELYALTADHVKEHWDGGTGTIAVGVGAGIAEKELSDREIRELLRRCRASGGQDCDVVPSGVSFSITTERPGYDAMHGRYHDDANA